MGRFSSQGSSHISVLGFLQNKPDVSKGDNSNQDRDNQEPETGTAATAAEEPLVEEHEDIEAKRTEGIQILHSQTMPELGGQEVQHGSPGQQLNENALKTSPSEDNAASRKLDRFGFILNVDSNGNVCEVSLEESGEDQVPTFAEARRTERREKKWNTTIDAWDRRRPKLMLRRLRKGIPDSIRGKVWVLLGGGIRQVGLYDQIVRITGDVQEESTANERGLNPWRSPLDGSHSTADSKKAPGASKKQKIGTSAPEEVKMEDHDDFVQSKGFKSTQDTIERDIHRTYPRHDLFYEEERSDLAVPAINTDEAAGGMLQGLCDSELTSLVAKEPEAKTNSPNTTPRNTPGGQAALRRVLRAYSYYDREVGYCQGMNFIAGMFLTIMSEEDAFWLLVAVMKEKPCEMRGLFLDGMIQTHKVLHVAERLTQQFLPRLFKHFEKENIHVTMYATQWLLTQYTSSFKFDLVTRVWDCFLGEGWKIIYRVMLALLSQWQGQLLKMSFEEILSFFRELPDRVEGSTVMDTALKLPLRKKHIVKYEKEWQARQADAR